MICQDQSIDTCIRTQKALCISIYYYCLVPLSTETLLQTGFPPSCYFIFSQPFSPTALRWYVALIFYRVCLISLQREGV